MTSFPLPIAAFLAGLISFMSPCVLPLVPGYVSLISGTGVEELKSQDARVLRKLMLNSAAFILGFSVVFITLGAISTEVGQLLARYKSLLAQVAGVVIILFGLHLTGLLRINALYADKRLHNVKGGNSTLGAFAVGFGLCLWLDTMRGADSSRDPRLCSRSEFLDQGNPVACHLLIGTGGPIPADFPGYRALPEVLRSISHVHARG
jgi:Cytochrome C biogenesis protein transmembrane region